MEIEKFFLDEFKIDNNVKKNGGEAIVFKASHPYFGEVAIKEWTRAAHKIDNEIKLLLQNCNHPNIIQFIGILMNNKSKYIGYIMPYMANGSLADGQMVSDLIIVLVIHNKAEKYDEKQISSWIIQICYGLSYLHFRKIIHRDIKPSNILLGKSRDEVKLTDFGMARSTEKKINTLTKGLGTPLYMSPEMLRRKSYDNSVDIYSLSITIWEILYRRIPYDSLIDELDLPIRICNGERPQLTNDLSKEVSDLLTRCWHTDASKRPTIDSVRDFCSETTFSLMDLDNSVNECETSFEHLNVDNNESLSKTITGKTFEGLEEMFADNSVQSTNVYNKRTVVPRQVLHYDEAFPKVTFKKPTENFHITNPVGQSPEEQTILLLGGFDGGNWNSVLMLENNGQNWKQLNIKLPYSIRGHGAQFLNNNIYIFGGGKSYEEPLNCTYKLSKTLKWEKMADMNQTRCYISNSNVILNDQIWICGGQDEKYNNLKSVEMYDPEINKWKYMKEMNECRYNPAAAVVNGKIFCSGDFSIYSVECYDPSSDVWTLICNIPQKIWGHGAVEMNGNFIFMGGYADKCLNSVWALDTTDKNAKWIEKPSMSISRGDFSIAKIHDKIFVCGGHFISYDFFRQLSYSVEIFDGKVWRDGPNMPTPRSNASAVVIPMRFARFLEQSTAFSIESSRCSVQ